MSPPAHVAVILYTSKNRRKGKAKYSDQRDGSVHKNSVATLQAPGQASSDQSLNRSESSFDRLSNITMNLPKSKQSAKTHLGNSCDAEQRMLQGLIDEIWNTSEDEEEGSYKGQSWGHPRTNISRTSPALTRHAGDEPIAKDGTSNSYIICITANLTSEHTWGIHPAA